uniref:BTB domain-containing protein n=1 Tax=Acrobeloides nanus TaxID=290746 RepID=A0A914EHL8_9BILA
MDHSDVIKLDVGGKKFETTKSTITKYDTMLRRMFADNFEPKLNSEGYVFIDRPGKNFDYILNCMRDGKVALPTDRNQVKQILMEA